MVRAMFRRLLLALLLCAALAPGLAAAQAEDGGTGDGGETDGGVPTVIDGGTVGEGGADRDNEEGQDSVGRVPVICERSSDCGQGFGCVEGRCRWRGVREAEGGFGCGGGGHAALAALLLPLGVALLGRRRA